MFAQIRRFSSPSVIAYSYSRKAVVESVIARIYAHDGLIPEEATAQELRVYCSLALSSTSVSALVRIPIARSAYKEHIGDAM